MAAMKKAIKAAPAKKGKKHASAEKAMKKGKKHASAKHASAEEAPAKKAMKKGNKHAAAEKVPVKKAMTKEKVVFDDDYIGECFAEISAKHEQSEKQVSLLHELYNEVVDAFGALRALRRR